MSKEQFERMGLPSSEGMQATIIGSAQRAPKQRMGKRGKGMQLPAFVQFGRMVLAARKREEAEARGKGKRPASIGTYVRKDAGACKLIPRK